MEKFLVGIATVKDEVSGARVTGLLGSTGLIIEATSGRVESLVTTTSSLSMEILRDAVGGSTAQQLTNMAL